MTEVTKLATVQESKQNTENNNSRRNTGYLEDTFDDRPIRWNHWISPAEIELESPPLGEGSYGTVFRGKCRGAIVAVKVLGNQHMDEENLRFFKREVEILSGMRAPNIVLFLGACCEPEQYMVVTELIPMGDLDAILHSRKIHLSLFLRMKMARDAAAGMSWLHQNDPQILHRDLKPSNMLVERDSWTIKLCDFGLAAIKESKKSRKNGENILSSPTSRRPVGTPIWMAPEVMNSEGYSTKTDVYSFGIVLWQLLTRSEPFLELFTTKEIFEAVYEKKRRPIIPENASEHLRNLIESCWDQNPANRPEFKEVIPILDEIIVESAINDPNGSTFWKNRFLNKYDVPWSDFWNELAELLPTSSITEENVDCLYKLLNLHHAILERGEPSVSIEQFGKLLDWIPNSLIPGKADFLLKVRDLCAQPWFFGELDTTGAAERLTGHEKGTFLIRFSTSQPGCYTLSRIDDKSNILHTRIPFEGGCYVADGKKYSSIDEIVDDMTVACRRPLPGSPFLSLFSSQHDVGYKD